MFKVLMISVVAILAAGAASAADKQALLAEDKAVMMQYGQALKRELLAAIEAQGAPQAIDVCNIKAPAIAGSVSAGSGWTVARSSHKLRNPANRPDAYTAAAIDDFLKRQAAGEKAGDIATAGIVEEDGARVFRLVKAIPTEQLCLACHGEADVDPAVAAKLAELYPDDKARGFSVGDMRGVFTLSKRLE